MQMSYDTSRGSPPTAAPLSERWCGASVEGRSAAWRASSVEHFCPSCVRGRPQRWPANALERGAREKRPLLGAVPGQSPKAAALSPEVLGACSRHADVDTRDNTRPRKGRFSSPLAEGSIFVATPRAPVSEADAAVRCVERGLQKRLPGMLSHCVHTYITSTHTYTYTRGHARARFSTAHALAPRSARLCALRRPAAAP